MVGNLDFGGVLKRLKRIGDKISELVSVIGNTDNGLIKDVNELKTVVGDEDSGLVKDVNTLEDDVEDIVTAIGNENSGLVKNVADLQSTVGDDNSGLVKDVSDLQDTIGDENSGLVKEVNDLESSISPTNFIKNGEPFLFYCYYTYRAATTLYPGSITPFSNTGSSLTDLFYYDYSTGQSVSTPVPDGKYYVKSFAIARENGQMISGFSILDARATTYQGNIENFTYNDSICAIINNNQFYSASGIFGYILCSGSPVTIDTNERIRIALTAYKVY